MPYILPYVWSVPGGLILEARSCSVGALQPNREAIPVPRQARNEGQRFQAGSYEFTPIASTGDRFTDFAPYVPAVNNLGVVAFQATLRAGGAGGFAGPGGPALSRT